jgi:hypothetical protein
MTGSEDIPIMSEESKNREKKAYQPPQLTVISLRPEEAVLGHCKNASTAGPGPTCTNLGGCQPLGS